MSRPRLVGGSRSPSRARQSRDRPQQPGGLPADDHPGVHIDHDRDVDPSRVGLHVGDVRDPQPFPGRRREVPVDEVGCRAKPWSLSVVTVHAGPWRLPTRPICASTARLCIGRQWPAFVGIDLGLLTLSDTMAESKEGR